VDASDATQVVVIDESLPVASPQWMRVEAPALEIGAGTFLMAGGATGGYLGVTPFLLEELGSTWALRPSLLLGESVPGDPRSTLLAGRFEGCVRLPDNFAHGSGVQLDVCGGVDAGIVQVAATQAITVVPAQTMPYVDLGPSVDLRAEVGRLAVLLRGVAGIDVARDSYRDGPGSAVAVSGGMLRFELAFSWMVHHREVAR
jgi:hypothetical protein